MNGLDLDMLKTRWAAQSRELDGQLELDVDAVRRSLTAHTATALNRQKRSRLRALFFGAAAVVALAAFMIAQRHELAYVLLALPLAGLGLAQFVVDLREWLRLQQLDFGMPLLQLRAEYDVLRARRVQMARCIALLSVLLWLPLVLVVVKALAGVDLLQRLPFSVVASNIALGLVAIPVLEGIFRWFARRKPQSATVRRFVDETAGRDWQRASDGLDQQLAFERQLGELGPSAALHQRSAEVLPAPLDQARRRLRWRIDAGLALITLLVLCSGGFNARHGGQLSALLPGIFLHLCGIGWLIGSVWHHDVLARPRTSLQAWAARLAGVSRGRGVLLQSYVVATPLLVLALLQVLGLGLGAVDLSRTLGLAVWLGLGTLALLAMALLWRRWRRQGSSFAGAAVEALSLGSLSRSRALAAAVGADEATAPAQREAA